jgi:ABC-type Fe3+/spermidine/putrescine transport system ATPase subunit
MIRLEGLKVRAGDFTLDVDELAVAPGEYLMVLGPTASGKTLLLESIAGLRALQAGHVWFGPRDVTGEPPERRKAGLVYQDYALFPHLTVAANVGFGLPREARPERVAALARLVGIGGLLDRYPEGLSGGEKQRVALARALAVEPELLLLDEPLSALDGPTRLELRRELKRLHGELGATVIHVTHDLDEAMALGDRMAVLVGGALRQVGTTGDVTRRPADRQVAALVGITNVFEVEAVTTDEGLGTRARLRSGHRLVVDAQDKVGPVSRFAVVRAEEIEIEPSPPASAAAREAGGADWAGDGNRLDGIVRAVHMQSVHAVVEVELLPALEAAPSATAAPPALFSVDVLRPQVGRLGLEPGVHVRLDFASSAVHLCGEGTGAGL